jgi:hypothetical protein
MVMNTGMIDGAAVQVVSIICLFHIASNVTVQKN